MPGRRHHSAVVTGGGKDGYELEISYEENEADVTSSLPEEIKKSLHAGKIPEVYKDVITQMEVKEVRRKDTDVAVEDTVARGVYGTSDEMQARAGEGYFVRNPEANLVYCPQGEILRQKCIKKNGNIRYANKNACKHCPNRNKCYRGREAGKKEILQKTSWKSHAGSG